MSAGTITITAGREREGNERDFAGPDGTYPVLLVSVSEPVTEPSTMAESGSWTYRRWTFAIDGGEYDGQVLDARASTKSSPKSKQFQIISALFGKVPPVGTSIDIQKHLIGRSALVSVLTNDNGYPYIAGFMAAPGSGKAPAAPAPKPEPVATPAVADDSDLPF